MSTSTDCHQCKSAGYTEYHHSIEECPNREYICPHCGYRDTYNEVMGPHLNECPSALIQCTNEGCTDTVTRILMLEHSVTCAKAVVNCQYASIGCHKKFKRDEASKHETEYVKTHLKLAMKSIKRLNERPPQPLVIQQNTQLVTVVFQLKNYSELKQQNKHWTSPTFYTSIGGYKFVLVVFPNGYDEEQGTHVSCFVCLMPGEYDNILEWPVKGEITVELLNQLEDANHTRVTLPIDEENEFFPVDEEEVIENIEEDLPGVGQPNFIEQTYLERDSELNVQYLKNDSLYFRVKVTKLDAKPKLWLITTH